MADQKTGVISFGGKPKAQIHLIENSDGKKAQLYAANGVYLCDCPYEGDNEVGYAVGTALYNGYMAGWDNGQYAISKSVNKALYDYDTTFRP